MIFPYIAGPVKYSRPLFQYIHRTIRRRTILDLLPCIMLYVFRCIPATMHPTTCVPPAYTPVKCVLDVCEEGDFVDKGGAIVGVGVGAGVDAGGAGVGDGLAHVGS